VSALAQLQRDFFGELTAAGEGMRAGLDVYRRNMAANLHDALASAYPVVARLVGAAFFREAAARFARACPSASGDLQGFGASFAAFLREYPYAARLEYLADVARLEWAMHESFHEADAAGLDLGALAAVPAERHGELRLRLHPAVRLLASPHPVVSIWEANQAGRDGTPEGSRGPDFMLVARADLEVHVQRIEARDWHFLEALSRDASLEEAIAPLSPGAAAAFLGPALIRHARAGVIAGFTLPPGGA
jgi:hypothetical protein